MENCNVQEKKEKFISNDIHTSQIRPTYLKQIFENQLKFVQRRNVLLALYQVRYYIHMYVELLLGIFEQSNGFVGPMTRILADVQNENSRLHEHRPISVTNIVIDMCVMSNGLIILQVPPMCLLQYLYFISNRWIVMSYSGQDITAWNF